MNTQMPRRGRPSGGQNFNSTLSIVVAVVAVLIGFLILQDLSADDGSGSAQPDKTTTTTTAENTTTTTAVATNGFKIQVANASGVAQSAAKLGQQLLARGFLVQPAKNASDATAKQTVTKVLFVAGHEAEAQVVSAVLGGKPVEAMPAVIPTEDGSVGEAWVLIMLGTDLAGQTLPTTVNTNA
ncbi:MAG: LytR family transcriptional regulator [Actinobacteria bacterium]|nr:LytR family transcriptional regulator [Actinomycetota bacterium]